MSTRIYLLCKFNMDPARPLIPGDAVEITESTPGYQVPVYVPCYYRDKATFSFYPSNAHNDLPCVKELGANAIAAEIREKRDTIWKVFILVDYLFCRYCWVDKQKLLELVLSAFAVVVVIVSSSQLSIHLC